jgi:hypothetical protein
MDNLILSSTGLILSLIAAYMAMKAVELINEMMDEKVHQGTDDATEFD